MLRINHLTGFGWPAARGLYRFLRLSFDTSNGTDNGDFAVNLEEVIYLVGATEYPTSAMTDFALPTPLVASARDYAVSQEPWEVFDQTSGTGSRWWPADSATSGVYPHTEWVQIDLGEGNEITPTGVRISTTNNSRTPKHFDIHGSDTGLFSGEQALIHTEENTGPTPIWAWPGRTFTF